MRQSIARFFQKQWHAFFGFASFAVAGEIRLRVLRRRHVFGELDLLTFGVEVGRAGRDRLLIGQDELPCTA